MNRLVCRVQVQGQITTRAWVHARSILNVEGFRSLLILQCYILYAKAQESQQGILSTNYDSKYLILISSQL